MRKKTFFYRFDKNKHIFKSSNHNFFVENEEKTFDKLTSLLEKKELLKTLVNETNSKIEKYYQERIEKKKKLIIKKPYLNKYSEYLLNTKQFILSFKFSKILSYSDIEKITSSLWVNLIRVSWYDTVIEILVQNKEEILNSLQLLIDSELIIVNNIIKEDKEPEENNRYILSLENIEIDTINRKNLDILWEWKNIITSLSKEYISNSKLELDILKEIYQKYKKENSNVSIHKNDASLDYIFIFQNINWEFLEDIKILDWITNIEIIDTSSENTFKEIDFNIETRPISESIKELTKVFIVEDTKINSKKYYNNITYWILENNIEWEHPTSVWLLSMYWKIQKWQTILPKPECNIYNAVYENIFLDINKIIDEAEKNWCKIINISMWMEGFIWDNVWISTIAKIIDKSLENRDILLVLSWWNINPCKSNYQEISSENSNINIPKDSFSSLAIWAKNDKWLIELYSRKNNINPEYNIGDVKWYIYRFKDKKKPDLIDFWENIVFNWKKWWIWYWTSYAAPLIVNKAAKMLNTYNNISTNTIKALFYNHSSTEKYNPKLYLDRQTFERHIWKWEVDIDSIIDWNNKINIVIEDYIWNNEKKEYPIKLPEIKENNISINIKRCISYNPPIDELFPLKYCKFCVASQIWSNFYEEKYNEIYNSYDDKIEAQNKWDEWKKNKIEDKYLRPLNWVNYFWKNHLWVSNSFRENIINKKLYDEIKNDTKIIIEWHSRNNFNYQQKFSFVMTIDISEILDKESFITNFFEINNEVIIHWEDLQNINRNYELKEQAFIEINSNDISIDVESF